MSNTLLTETHCSRMLVAALGLYFGFDISNHMCTARRTVHGMQIQADVAGRRFSAELSTDELAMHGSDVMTRLVEQLQPQVFQVWAA